MNIDLSTPLEIAQQVSSTISSLKNKSLGEYTASSRLTPMVLIDKRLLTLDHKQLNGLMQTMLSVYSAYYLQAVNMAMRIGDVSVMRILDQFSTDRSLINAAGASAWLSNESIDDTKYLLPLLSNIGLEGSFGDNGWGSFDDGLNKNDSKIDNDKAIHNITDESNLVVGKIIDVKLVSGEHHTTIPVTVTLSPKGIEPEDFLNISRANGSDTSWTARWHMWRSGEIKFVKDFLLVQDIIEADKKALLADKTHTLLTTRSRRTKGVLAAIISGHASPNAVSTMILISKQTAHDLELILKGSLKSPHVRSVYFESTSAMMLVVVDPKMERFIMYQRGIADYKEYTLDDVKGNAKSTNGLNVTDIMQAYKVGSAASL